jgi:small subunit ribosomal protein S9
MKKSTEKKEEQSRAVGRRKTASARTQIKMGHGKIVINGKELVEYFPYFEWQETVMAPLKAVGKEKAYDISVKVNGGGKKGQSVAVQHGIARALVDWNAELRKTLKTLGFLTRDARVKERKKFGLKKARRAPQWSKR